jgi:hypothetical protein
MTPYVIFGRTFLNAAGANIDCKEENISLKFGEEQVKYHFSKFRKQPSYKYLKFWERQWLSCINFYGS